MKNWEIKTIEDIAVNMYSGNEITKAQINSGDYPAIRYSEIFNNDVQISECRYFVDPNLIKSKKYCEYGNLLISDVSENKQEVGKAVVYLGHDKPLIGTHICLLKHNQNPKFPAYMFTTKYVRKQLENIARPSTVFGISAKSIRQIKIPLPSLEKQKEIVHVLDQLNANLRDLNIKAQEMIFNRERQYNFRCQQILSEN